MTARLDGSEQTFVVVTLVPDLPGDFLVNSRTLRDFQQEVANKDPLIIQRGVSFQHVLVGSRRLIAHGGPSPVAGATYLACEPHQSGAGVFAAIADNRRPPEDAATSAFSRIRDEDLVLDVWSGLRFLARHARDRAAAGGHATVRVSLWPVTDRIPAVLVQDRGFGFEERLGRQEVTTEPVTTGAFDIDDLAEDGPPLVAATSYLVTGLIQHFGFPETLQMTSDGTIRTRYWNSQRYGPSVQRWATVAGVETTDETTQ
jgi:hypothetical protein